MLEPHGLFSHGSFVYQPSPSPHGRFWSWWGLFSRRRAQHKVHQDAGRGLWGCRGSFPPLPPAVSSRRRGASPLLGARGLLMRRAWQADELRGCFISSYCVRTGPRDPLLPVLRSFYANRNQQGGGCWSQPLAVCVSSALGNAELVALWLIRAAGWSRVSHC